MTHTSKQLRIVFAGTPVFAEQFLKLLIDTEHQIVGVYTQPDRPAGRGKKLKASPVKQLATENQIQVYQPLNFRDQEDRNQLSELNADLMIVVAYGIILPQSVLDTPKYGCINVHASLLPRWRGAAPIHRAIETGDELTGVTIMQMNAGLDTGDMLAKSDCSIQATETTASLHDKLIESGKPALLETLKQIANGHLSPEIQDDSAANYAHKIEKIEAMLDWSLDAQILDRKIRAFYPFPVAYSLLEGQRVKIHTASLIETERQGEPGKINQITEEGISVQTGQGTIRIEQLQLPGKKAMKCADVLRGYPDRFSIGQCFETETTTPIHSTNSEATS